MNVEKGCHEYGKLKLITLKNFASYFFIYENRWLKAEPFNVFTFNAEAVAVYQLGDFGTAAKKLWNWAPQR